MSILEGICPQCGGHSTDGEVCGRCRVAKETWVSCDARVRAVVCSTCGASRSGSVWRDQDLTRDEIATVVAKTAIHLHPECMPGEIKALVREEDPQRTTVIFTLSGTLWGEPVEKDCSVEVFWNKEQCDRCNRISGNYYEGVIQVRAEGRRPTPTELAAAQRIAAEVEETMQQRGERLSVIVREEETKDGLDLIVSSHQIGDEVAGSIVRAMGGRVTTHPKLAGERAGRPLYRVTYAVRLPNLTKGDIIWLNRTYGKVIEPGSRTFRYIDLNTGSVRVRRSADIQRLVGNIRDAEETIVAYVEGPVIGVLDPDSGATLECQAASWRKVLAGDRVKVLKDQDHLVIV